MVLITEGILPSPNGSKVARKGKPTDRHAARVSPEQSKLFGPAAAQTYFLPIWSQAYFAALLPASPLYTWGQVTGRSEPVPVALSP